MADRDIDINLSKTAEKDTVTNEDFLKGYRTRLAHVLERGVIADRLQVENLPDHLYGEWVPDDMMEITRKKALGFEIDTEYANKRALHSDGSGTNKIGDVIFMTLPKDLKVEIDRYNHRKFLEMHDPKRLKEEIDFRSQNALSTIDKNRTHSIGATDILESLKAAKNDGPIISAPNVMTLPDKG